MNALSAEFETFVRHRAPSLLRAAYLLTGDQYLAEDLVQTALARTHLSWRRLHDQGNAEAYTRKVMYHQQISWWRRRRGLEVPTETLPTRATTPDHAADAALKITLRAALQKLSDKQRAVLVLRFFEDRTEAETADVLGVTVGTVKSQTSKALARLRTLAPELAELAGEARPVDLAERAVRTSGRLKARRAMAVSAGVAAALVGIVGIVLAVLPSRNPAPDPAVSVPPAPSAAATPSASPTPSTRQPGAVVGGSAYWFAPATGDTYRLMALADGQVRELRSLGAAEECVSNSVRVSPDGAAVAWVRDDKGAALGELMVGGTTGGSARQLAANVFCGGLIWSRDGARLFVRGGDTGQGVVTVSSGKFTPMAGDAWTAALAQERDGYVGQVSGTQLTVVRADGGEPRTVAYTSPNEGDSAVLSVSADGRYAAVGFPHGDPSTSPAVYAVIDMTTGKKVRFPMPDVDSVFFQADGTVVVAVTTTHRIYRLGADLTVLAEGPLPEGATADRLLQYLP